MFSVPPHRGTDSDFHRFSSLFFFPVDVHLFRAGEELCEQAEGTTTRRGRVFDDVVDVAKTSGWQLLLV